MSTLLQLINEVLRRTGQQEVTTLNNATTPTVQAIDFLNETYFEMLQRLKVQPLTKAGSITTSEGVAAYTPSADHEPDGLLPDSLQEESTQQRLREVAYTYPLEHGETASGLPRYFYRNGSQIHLYPIPDGVYTIRYQYRVKPQAFNANNDVTALPESWERILILGTQARLEKFLGEDGNDNYLLYRDGLTQLKSMSPLKPAYRMKGFYRGARSI